MEEPEDITTCCICTEVYTDPKALPCIHTFCMKCILETGLTTNKGPGDEMPCPICRRLFKIPTEGFQGLPKHFFIERLIQVSKVLDPSSAKKVLCSACLEESKEQTGKEIPTAGTYCVECKYNLCEECCSEHKKFKLTKNHKLIPISEDSDDKNVLTDHAPNVCEAHDRNIMNVYCADCKTVECAICFIEKHDSHKGSHVNNLVDGFRNQIQKNTESVNGCIAQAQMKKTELLKVKKEIQERVVSLECEVLERKVEIKEHIDKHASSLLQRLSWEQQSRLKEIQMATDDIDAYISHLESYNCYCPRIVVEGSASDICRALSDLSFRASELQQQCQPVIEIGTRQFQLCFRQSELELLDQDCDNLVGEIEEEGDSKPKKPNTKKLLTEQLKEIAILKQENDEIKANYKGHLQEMDKNKTAINTLQDSYDKLKKEFDAEKSKNKSLQTINDGEKANNKSQIEKLKKELEDKKTAMNALQAKNDKLKQEFDAEKSKNKSLQTINDSEKANNKSQIEKLKKELEENKAAMNTLQAKNDKLKQEFDVEKSKSNSLQTSRDKINEELEKYKATLEACGLETNVENLRKQLVEFKYKSDPVLVHTIRTKATVEKKKGIRGLTILDKELFVVSELFSEVEVYDAIKVGFSRRWKLKELTNPTDMGSCNKNKCLYINESKVYGQSMDILRVDPDGILINKWSTGDDWGCGLSVTDESNVVVAVYYKEKLNEYSPNGQLIREINLLPDADRPIRHPMHAIKLTNGYFMVSDGYFNSYFIGSALSMSLYGSLFPSLFPSLSGSYRVFTVDAGGKLEKSFGARHGFPGGQTYYYPVHLSVGGNGFVLVADRLKQRVLLLDSELNMKREIISNEKHELQVPSRISLDASNGRLFVADNEKGNERILIFDFKLFCE